MTKRIKCDNIVLPDGTKRGYVYFEDGVITYVGEEERMFGEEIDAEGFFLLPGPIDVHTHGAAGHDYSDGDAAGVLAAVKFSVLNGATSVMPTVTSSSYEKTCAALSAIEEAMRDEEFGARIIGAHLEGPYFSPAQCGAQDKKYITAPQKADYERIADRFGGVIKRWDYAPERDAGGEFCRYLVSRGILPAAGHTDAKYRDMLAARENGCRLITHLYSCTSSITREKGYRSLGVTECAYLWDDLYAEIIADGSHLPKELLRLIFKLKSPDRLILISDSMSVTGTKEKTGRLGGVDYIIEDGVCKLTDRSAFAGSIATAGRLIEVCLAAGADLFTAAKMSSENPARLFGLNKGAIEAGRDADFIVLDNNYHITKVIAGGEEKK
ncbi:MAG: amidohydrolase family protein [Clostridia bacterium]|nr:amidohydrolase family protein [Clostridia bacterium]